MIMKYWTNLNSRAKLLLLCLLVIFIFLLLNNNSRGYSDNDIVSLQKSMGISREEAIKILDEFDAVAKKENSNK